MSFIPQRDLASLRLACHDFSVRAAPALFSDLSITFKTRTFTRPGKLAALDRLGFYVRTLRFELPHTSESFLPPLVEPETGAELSFTYTPQIDESSSPRRPKYGDIATTEILTRQYPPIFHAATNVPAFVRAFSSLINLEHLVVSCPGYDASTRYRRSVVDYALISLRIAIERNCLNALDTLTLSPIHPGGIMHLSPMLGLGATPRSATRWTRTRKLAIHINKLAATNDHDEPDQFKLLQTYLRNYQSRLETFDFRWIGHKGPLPAKPIPNAAPSLAMFGTHPAHQYPSKKNATAKQPAGCRPLHFRKLKHCTIENVSTPAADISAFVAIHRSTIEQLNLDDIDLTSGTWDEALHPLTEYSHPHRSKETFADIPIMLEPDSPSTTSPTRMERVEISAREGDGRTPRVSEWLGKTPTARRVREGLLGCEMQLKKVFRGSALPWR